MDEKDESEQADDQTRERQASELQAQIDDLISGKGDTEVQKPRTLRDLAELGRKNSTPPLSKRSEESVQSNECEDNAGEGS